jgi:Protein of unknown function (DUF2490)
MPIRLKNIALATALLFAFSAHGETIEDGRLWLTVNAVGKLPVEHWHWYAELQPRWRHEGSELDQLIIRPAIYYALNDHSSIWMGYAHVVTHPAGRSAFEENRLWQQYLYNFSPIKSVSIQSRTRFEQRWLENSDDTGYKLRQLVRLTTPSNLHPNLTWVVYDEYFVNLNNTDYSAKKGFDQNRAFIGGNWALSQHAKLEIGYLNQYVNGIKANAENHVLSTTLLLNF